MPKPPANVPQHNVTGNHNMTGHHNVPGHHSSHHTLPAPHHSTSSHHNPGVVLISQKPLESNHSHGHNHIEPSEIGVIPPQFMSNSSLTSSFSSTMTSSTYNKQDSFSSAAAHRSLSPERPAASTAHHWTNNPVEMWAKEQVGNWLLALNMEMYIPRFLDSNVTGEILLNLDSTTLKQLGVVSKNDREKIKEKIKELRKQNEKEKKEVEKERKKKEKAAKTAGSKTGKR